MAAEGGKLVLGVRVPDGRHLVAEVTRVVPQQWYRLSCNTNSYLTEFQSTIIPGCGYKRELKGCKVRWSNLKKKYRFTLLKLPTNL